MVRTYEDEINEYRRVFKDIFTAFKKVPFYMVVRAHTGQDILPFDAEDKANALLLKELKSLIRGFAKPFNTTPITKEIYITLRSR